MNWSSVKGYIFDVDGTLYSQMRLRFRMLLRLLSHYARHPLKVRELLAVYYFRRMREHPDWQNVSTDQLSYEISKMVSLPFTSVKDTIWYWMFQNPLDLLHRCAYKDVVAFVNRSYEEGKQIYCYSDYPCSEKLNRLGIKASRQFFFGQEHIKEQKPSIEVMKYIMSEINLPVEQMAFVGDREDKDKASADLVGIRYYDIRQFRELI